MMARGSNIPGHILITHLPPPRRKKRYGPLVHREIHFKPKNSKETLLVQKTCPPAMMAGAKVDAIDFEPKEDDLMDDDTKMDDGNADVVPICAPKLKSTITGTLPGSTMAAMTTPKQLVSEKKLALNTIASLKLESRNSRGPNWYVLGRSISL
jgi:hypothetical protein